MTRRNSEELDLISAALGDQPWDNSSGTAHINLRPEWSFIVKKACGGGGNKHASSTTQRVCLECMKLAHPEKAESLTKPLTFEGG